MDLKKDLKKDKFKIDATIHNTLDGYNHMTMVKSLSIFMMQLPEVLKRKTHTPHVS